MKSPGRRRRRRRRMRCSCKRGFVQLLITIKSRSIGQLSLTFFPFIFASSMFILNSTCAWETDSELDSNDSEIIEFYYAEMQRVLWSEIICGADLLTDSPPFLPSYPMLNNSASTARFAGLIFCDKPWAWVIHGFMP